MPAWQMTGLQTVFTLFFAIFWGTVANAWPRWRPFNWAFFFDRRVSLRVTWSMLMLNIAPILFFGYVFFHLGGAKADIEHWRDIFTAVVPAFGVFGIYRIWIAGIEFCPRRFYYQNEIELQKHNRWMIGSEPTVSFLKLNGEMWWSNLLFGLLHVMVAWIFAMRLW
jgi:hypothetical protein